MAFEQEFFDELMQYSMTVESFTGEDAHGNNQYGTPSTMLCRLDLITKRVGTTDQQEQLRGETVTTITAIAPTTTTVNPRDRLTLESGLVVFVQSVDIIEDEDVPHHQTIQATEGDIS